MTGFVCRQSRHGEWLKPPCYFDPPGKANALSPQSATVINLGLNVDYHMLLKSCIISLPT